MAKGKKATTVIPDIPNVAEDENPFGDNDLGGGEDDSTKASTTRTEIIQHLIKLCGFSEDSTMVKYIDQQQWEDLSHILIHDVGDVKDFYTVKDDGTFEAKPLSIHLRMFKAFLLYYRRKCIEYHDVSLSEAQVLLFQKASFRMYCCSSEFMEDLKAGDTTQSTATTKTGGQGTTVIPSGSLSVQEFRCSVKRDKAHYEDLKDDKYFNSWNRGFVATARMHHTDLVLDENYYPKTAEEKFVFEENANLHVCCS
jgi:hypothetical protein